MSENTFNPFDFCDEIHIDEDGTVILHNAKGEYDYSAISAWAKDLSNANNPKIIHITADLTALRASFGIQIDVKTATALDAGFDYNGKKWPADNTAISVMNSKLQKYQRTGDVSLLTFQAKKEYTLTQFDEAGFNALFDAGYTFVDTLFAKVRSCKAAMLSANTKTDVETAFNSFEE